MSSHRERRSKSVNKGISIAKKHGYSHLKRKYIEVEALSEEKRRSRPIPIDLIAMSYLIRVRCLYVMPILWCVMLVKDMVLACQIPQ